MARPVSHAQPAQGAAGAGAALRVVAATLEGETVAPAELPRDRPLALVLGGEERGVSHEALEVCRRRVRIPGSGRVQSLNVAQAAAVLLAALA